MCCFLDVEKDGSGLGEVLQAETVWSFQDTGALFSPLCSEVARRLSKPSVGPRGRRDGPAGELDSSPVAYHID